MPQASEIPRGEIHCLNCGAQAKTGGAGWDIASVLIALILLVCFFFPGVIYILWRGSRRVCRNCGNTNIIVGKARKPGDRGVLILAAVAIVVVLICLLSG